jgi:hypothetical protein
MSLRRRVVDRVRPLAGPCLLGIVLTLAPACGGSDDATSPSESPGSPAAGTTPARTADVDYHPRPDLPANRVERGRLLVEGTGCLDCHNMRNVELGRVPVLEGIGFRVIQWKEGSTEEAVKWLVELLTYPKRAAVPPWRQGLRYRSSSLKPGYGITLSPNQIEDMAYYLLTMWDIPGER